MLLSLDQLQQAQVAPEEMALVKLCQHVWSLSTPDEDNCLDGMQMRSLMMMSGLDNGTLGTIWTMVDNEQRGKVSGQEGLCECFFWLVSAFSFLISLTATCFHNAGGLPPVGLHPWPDGTRPAWRGA